LEWVTRSYIHFFSQLQISTLVFALKATSHAFALAGYLPIPKFIDTNQEHQSMLSAWVYHHCLDMVFAKLKTADCCGATASDADG
jgi:hypothetical protein